MRIIFKAYESTQTNPNKNGKVFNIYRVKGTAIGGKLDGQEWTTQFFASARDMAGQVKSLNAGDVVDVKLITNGNFLNPISFTKVDGKDADLTVVPQSSGSANYRETANPIRPANPRLDNIKVATRILGPKGKKNGVDYMMEAGVLADLVDDYINDKGVFQFDKDTIAGVPDADDVEKEDTGE